MRLSAILVLLFSFMIIISCSLGKLKQSEVDTWLNAISGSESPALDISGNWYDAKEKYLFGWGEGYLQQDHNKVRGAIGSYNIKGIVSGKKVYLVFISGGTVYYMAYLEMLEDGLLVGNYFEADDKELERGYPTSLQKR
ncbi:MAG: hypothetical protein R6X10_07350 [Desulfobacterales bacterium]